LEADPRENGTKLEEVAPVVAALQARCAELEQERDKARDKALYDATVVINRRWGRLTREEMIAQVCSLRAGD